MIGKFSTAGQAIADYRARTATMSTSSQCFYCSTCHQSRDIVGRKALPSIGKRRLYECEICQKAGQA